ncbi:evasin P1124-like [Ixodes scapularis]|uniref:evasin P1124-like n=1 Tax=Ixodes scapularis TaxID=6945 RepID=UPI001A9CCAD1|nr:evasin P1124-like [Ixodes scapularis]
MAVNVFTILQLIVFVAIVFNVNLHSVSAESKEPSASEESGKSIELKYCETNCTKTDGEWCGCTDGCICVHAGDSDEGRCLDLGDTVIDTRGGYY